MLLKHDYISENAFLNIDSKHCKICIFPLYFDLIKTASISFSLNSCPIIR